MGEVHSLTVRSWCSMMPPSNLMVRRPPFWTQTTLRSEWKGEHDAMEGKDGG